jgi:hypothetical protein
MCARTTASTGRHRTPAKRTRAHTARPNACARQGERRRHASGSAENSRLDCRHAQAPNQSTARETGGMDQRNKQRAHPGHLREAHQAQNTRDPVGQAPTLGHHSDRGGSFLESTAFRRTACSKEQTGVSPLSSSRVQRPGTVEVVPRQSRKRNRHQPVSFSNAGLDHSDRRMRTRPRGLLTHHRTRMAMGNSKRASQQEIDQLSRVSGLHHRHPRFHQRRYSVSKRLLPQRG